MTALASAVDAVVAAQLATGKPLAIVVAGHNGSGKSTLWYRRLAGTVRIPLVNADRMMLSILPETTARKGLPSWAAELRDEDTTWMQVAQKGVEAFVAQAMLRKVPFAMETVFSHYVPRADGTFESKVDLVRQMQVAGYFVLLLFVGLSSAQLSVARVSTRVAQGGHAVDAAKLLTRFPRTQQAVHQALTVADATLLTDNSRSQRAAFTVCRVQLATAEVFDVRAGGKAIAPEIDAWLRVVCPRA